MQRASTPAISLKNVSYHYTSHWTFQRRPVLKNVNLEVINGEAFGFLGHNGAGKTTTIKCMLGLLRIKEGEVFVNGISSRETRARQALGYLPEHPYFYNYLSVSETLHMYAALAGIPAKERHGKVAKALELVKLSGRSKSPLHTLSKGLTQRVAMAQAIVAEPAILILDEPLSGLDPLGRKDFRELLAQLKQSGTTIFMASHILSDVEFLCDRVSIMSHGEIKGVFDLRSAPELESGAYELVVRRNPASMKDLAPLADSMSAEDKFLRLTFKERARAEHALRLALENQAGVESFEFVHGNLEDLFVKLVNFNEQAAP